MAKSIKAKDDKSIIIGMILLILIAAAISALTYFVLSEKDKVANGTSIFITDELSQSIGDMSYDEAVNKTNRIIDEYLNSKVNLTDQEKTLSVSLKDIGVTINIDDAINEIRNSLYTPYIIDSLERHKTFNKKIPLVTNNVKIDINKFCSYVDTSMKHIQKSSQDAELFVNKNGEVEIKPNILGRSLDRSKLLSDIIAAVKEYNLSIKTPTFTLTPQLTDAKIKELMPAKLMSSFTTYYGWSGYGRKVNLELGTSLINNVLLKPGEEFEYWKYVGETTYERGFKDAAVYQNGALATGIGGGLCQVATTLYDAALLADLEITERSPHGLPVSYIGMGLDATVDIDSFSLRFINNTNKYMLIKSSADGDALTFSIYGDMPEGKTVKIYAYNIAQNAAVAYRDIYMNGNLVKHEDLGESWYN